MNWRPALTVIFLMLSAPTTALGQQEMQSDVGAFVRGTLFPNSYKELATSFDASITPELVSMLNSKAEEEHWLRIAGMLGVVGDERAVGSLIAFVEKSAPARLSQWHHDGRTEAIRALGFLVHRTHSERALRYLTDGLTPSVWRQRNVMGLAPNVDSYAEYDIRLSTYAVFGLALSGHPAAGEALRTVLRSPTSEQRLFRERQVVTIRQWLEIHDVVAERGVAGMYEHYENRRRIEAERQLQEGQRLRKAQQQLR